MEPEATIQKVLLDQQDQHGTKTDLKRALCERAIQSVAVRRARFENCFGANSFFS
jgi:hypothetical protein